MQLATWLTKTLEVSAERICAFEALSYTVEIETKDQTKSKQIINRRKKTKPRTLSFDLVLHSSVGVEVHREIDDWDALAHAGKYGKFYVGGKSIGTCSYLLSSMKVTEARFGPTGEMTSAKLALSFSQATKNGVADSGTDGAKKKKKKKKKSRRKPNSSSKPPSGSSGSGPQNPKKPQSQSPARDAARELAMQQAQKKKDLKKATDDIKRIAQSAKDASKQTK